MTLCQMIRPYCFAILIGVFSLQSMLHSTTLLAASAEDNSQHSVTVPPAFPAMGPYHDPFFKQFRGGRLEYRPDPRSDAGLVILPFRDILAPIADSADPISSTFDLSRCGDAGQHISIHIGYKKEFIPANACKTEIWICPRFLVAEELGTTASYLAPIMDKWEAPVGYFWTWGEDDVKSDNYSYLLNRIVMDNGKDIYRKWCRASNPCVPCAQHPSSYANFRVVLNVT